MYMQHRHRRHQETSNSDSSDSVQCWMHCFRFRQGVYMHIDIVVVVVVVVVVRSECIYIHNVVGAGKKTILNYDVHLGNVPLIKHTLLLVEYL